MEKTTRTVDVFFNIGWPNKWFSARKTSVICDKAKIIRIEKKICTIDVVTSNSTENITADDRNECEKIFRDLAKVHCDFEIKD